MEQRLASAIDAVNNGNNRFFQMNKMLFAILIVFLSQLQDMREYTVNKRKITSIPQVSTESPSEIHPEEIPGMASSGLLPQE